jgi:hypothetical protein
VEVEERQGQNQKAQRSGIEEEVIALETVLPASLRAPDPARRP